MSSSAFESALVDSGLDAFDTGLFSAVCAELEDAKEVQPPTLVAIPGQDGLLKKWAITYFAAAVCPRFLSVKGVFHIPSSKNF
jgi:hypothetical protein